MQTTHTTHNTSATTNPSDTIATEAYYQWLKAGKPPGRDQEFWLKAEAEMKKGNGKAKNGAKSAGKH